MQLLLLFWREIIEVPAPIADLPELRRVDAEELASDRGEPLRILGFHVLEDAPRELVLARHKEMRGQLDLGFPHAAKARLLSDGLTLFIDLEEDMEERIERRALLFEGKFIERAEIVGGRLKDEGETRVEREQAIIFEVVCDLDRARPLIDLEDVFSEEAVLIEDVIGRPHILRVDRGAEISVEEFDRERVELFMPIGHRPLGDEARIDRYEITDIALFIEGLIVERLIFPQDLHLEPDLAARHEREDLGRHRDEVGVMREHAIDAEEFFGELLTAILEIEGHTPERVDALHRDGLIFMLHRVEADVGELLDPAERLLLFGCGGAPPEDHVDGMPPDAIDDLERVQEVEDEGEIRQEQQEAHREHADGRERGEMRRVARDVFTFEIEDAPDKDGHQGRDDEEAHHKEVRRLSHEELSDAMRIPIGRELDDDGDDGDGDAEDGGDDLGEVPEQLGRRIRIRMKDERDDPAELTARIDIEDA